jgi:hypothetical protein
VTRTGRFVAAVGATALGVLAVAVYSLSLGQVMPDGGGVAFTVASGLVACALFGVVTAAFYTWTVDNPFVSRHQPRR